jgi:hypothetical protein
MWSLALLFFEIFTLGNQTLTMESHKFREGFIQKITGKDKLEKIEYYKKKSENNESLFSALNGSDDELDKFINDNIYNDKKVDIFFNDCKPTLAISNEDKISVKETLRQLLILIASMTKVNADKRSNSMQQVVEDKFFDSIRDIVDDIAINSSDA